ncbi:LytTR family DNA-binding domain-containing protein [Sphingobacterium sp. lm-10]|uniref:LytR/AlgR family response regulator transcription factor n=1 Tax=Sphingobacterium sp. lm-10 TaxID=2944904 RepID=UPI002020C80E|nr:LytTR family DNA-binding domain-containing protein [Sphingobacterium sp. lm-10]MCL7989311.1 LytTR family DNA-binding domain-containing protein [Sphingobacterium sp. lm-10]
MKILIVEDEKPNADRLKRLIKELRPRAEVIGVLECVSETLDWLAANACPDVMLMDVRLSDGLSFEILERKPIDCPIIFTTAYDEYAVRAFKHNSIDYLLKPVEKEELSAALEKLESQQHPSVLNQHALDDLIHFFQPKPFRKRFLLPYKDGYKSILVQDVIYFYSEWKITRARLSDGSEEVIPLTMEELEQQVDSSVFFRANRQFIVCVDAIGQVHNYFNGKLKVDIKQNPALEVIISREKASLFKNWLNY